MKKYFKVTAKCGHVGRGYYYPGEFFVMADSAKEAASKVRCFPRVKHDHKDAILSVDEITKIESIYGMARKRNTAYYYCHNIQQQNLIEATILDKLEIDLKQEDKPKYKNNKHSLRKAFNNDDTYNSLKNYHGAINHYEVA